MTPLLQGPLPQGPPEGGPTTVVRDETQSVVVAEGREERLRRIAHDLRNCLYTIGMAAEIVRTARHEGGQATELWESIAKDRATAEGLVTDFLRAASDEA